MTSALSLLRQLNGSSIFFCFLMVIVSCNPSKRATVSTPSTTDQTPKEYDGEDKVYNSNSQKYESPTVINTHVDTVEWIEVPENRFPPVTDADINKSLLDKPYSPKKSFYDISLLMPLNERSYNYGKSNMTPFVKKIMDFYAGSTIAVKQLESEGINVVLRSYDTENNQSKLNSVIENLDKDGSDLIIGPYSKEQVEYTTQYAKRKEIPMISPWTSYRTVTENNPYYILINPALGTHCNQITDHILKRYEEDNVVVVLTNKNQNILRYFNNAKIEIQNDINAKPFNHIILSDESVELAETNFDSLLTQGGRHIVVLPEYSNPLFVSSAMRRLNADRKDREIILYGMPQWLNWNLDHEHLENLNVRISTPAFVDPKNPEVKDFKRIFYSEFNAIPSLDAYLGYDITLFAGKMLDRYGKKFQFYLGSGIYSSMTSQFNIGIAPPTSATVDDRMLIDCFENKSVQIIEFENYQYKIAND